MTSDDLSGEQIATLKEQVGCRLRWQAKVIERMNRLRWPHDDPLRQAVENARDGWAAIYRELYERSNGIRSNTSPFSGSHARHPIDDH